MTSSSTISVSLAKTINLILNPHVTAANDPSHADEEIQFGSIPHSKKTTPPKTVKKPLGSLLKTTLEPFRKYYLDVIHAEKQGKRSSAINKELANQLFKDVLSKGEIDNAVWLLRNGANSSAFKEFTSANSNE